MQTLLVVLLLSCACPNLVIAGLPAFWPVPQHYVCSEKTSLLAPSFTFKAVASTNSILERAFVRYGRIIKAVIGQQQQQKQGNQSTTNVQVVNVSIGPNTVLNSKTNETYLLDTRTSIVQLEAVSVYGALRGLETLSQMVHPGGLLDQCVLKDYPRFPFRGFLFDSSRHFLSVTVLKQLIDALAYNKFNVFHWHVVDDQSFPIEISSLPLLASKGAYGELQSHRYSQAQVQDLIQFAQDRGVRVVPEFDTPGHSTSWGKGYPDIVTNCYGSDGRPNGKTGPLDPTHNQTFQLLDQLWTEVASVFPDDYVHVGGDEVPFSCWQSNPQIQQFMLQHGWTDYALLENYYEQKLIDIVDRTQKRYVVWQEVFQNGIKLNSEAIVDVWKGPGWQDTLRKVTATGFNAILSAPWYLNYAHDPYMQEDGYKGDWADFYAVDPLNFQGTPAQKALVVGGEGCMWGEFVDNANVVSRTFPRASAVAERLWSPASVTNLTDADARLQVMQCRLAARGIQAEAIHNSDFCEPEFQVQYNP